jgi:hypothetical protein
MDGFIIINMAVALLCITLGYLIAVKQKRGLIAGWDESKFSNPEAFAKWVGFSVLILGVLIGLIALTSYLELISENVAAMLVVVVSLLPIPCVLIASARYLKHGI